MNYYNPYFNVYPYMNTAPKIGLFSRIFGNFNFGNLLSGTQKTLNIINQSIPIIKQAKPVINNAKTMFKVMNEFKKDNRTTNNTKIIEKSNISNSPTFFA